MEVLQEIGEGWVGDVGWDYGVDFGVVEGLGVWGGGWVEEMRDCGWDIGVIRF